MPLARLSVQLAFTAAVTVASLVFIVTPTTSGEHLSGATALMPSYGHINVSSRAFDPAQFKLVDFNDRAQRSPL